MATNVLLVTAAVEDTLIQVLSVCGASSCASGMTCVCWMTAVEDIDFRCFVCVVHHLVRMGCQLVCAG